ncbi:MAG: response regulator [Desulfobacterales bacterium]|nr:MAG: response regulator [Desulfobacterales bacterium]
MAKILVIDDEKPTLSMFRLFLEAWGYLVLTAENGTEGLEIYRKEKPAIVITDIKMPGIDGLAVLQHIIDIDPKAVVVVITGHGDTDLAQRALESQAVDLIHKPIKKEALEAALKKARERLDLASDTDSR